MHLEEMYDEIREALETSAKDPRTTLTVISGRGDYFSSGNDLSNFVGDLKDKESMARSAKVLLERYVSAYIDHPKPLVALVHGPAIGVFVSILGLFDIVYASDRATFHAPFSFLGQSPEGCSSFTFPRIMGLSKASEVLLFGKKLTAEEACKNGLVTEVFAQYSFEEQTAKKLKAYADLPPQSMILSKGIIRDSFRSELHKVNTQECQLLEERWQSDECANAIMNFFSGKSKV